MALIVVVVALILLGVFVLIFHGALAFGYKRGGVWGLFRMAGAVIFHEFMVIFFH